MQRHCVGLFCALKQGMSAPCYNDHMDAAKIEIYTQGGECSVAEAASILGISRWSVRDRIMTGELIGWRPTPSSRNYKLWRRQVMDMAADQRARAIRRANILSTQMVLDI